jgi:hypothetical protein
MKKDVHAESAAALIDEKIKELGDWRDQPDGQFSQIGTHATDSVTNLPNAPSQFATLEIEHFRTSRSRHGHHHNSFV